MHAPTFILPALEVPTKIFADGTEAPANDPRTDHVALHYTNAGFMVHPYSLGDGGDSVSRCEALCGDLRVLDLRDWLLAPLQVWERYIIDRTRINPAVDQNLYPGIKSGWHWTSSDYEDGRKNAAGVPASAWGVYAGYGGVNNGHRYSSGFGLAVRRVGQ